MTFVLIGLNYLGTVSLVTGTTMCIVEGGMGALKLSKICLNISEKSIIDKTIKCSLGAVSGFIICGTMGAIKGIVFPIKTILLTLYWGKNLMRSIISYNEMIANSIYNLDTFIVMLKNHNKFENLDFITLIIELPSSNSKITSNQSKTIESTITKNQFEKIDILKRKKLLNGNKIEILCAYIASSIFMTNRELFSLYKKLKNNKYNSHILIIDNFNNIGCSNNIGYPNNSNDPKFYIINIQYDKPIFFVTNDVNQWKYNKKCNNCSLKFGYIYLRRHHCRICFESICDNCIEHIYDINSKSLVKVCIKCYVKTKNYNNENVNILEKSINI